jgi:hypothetical protein
LDAIAYHLERIRAGSIRRLIINVPPRYVKSIMVSVAFPALLSGHERVGTSARTWKFCR